MRLFVGYSNLHIIISKTNTIVLLKPIFFILGRSTSTIVNPQLLLLTIVLFCVKKSNELKSRKTFLGVRINLIGQTSQKIK